MAKRSRSGYASADDDVGEDRFVETDADPATDDPAAGEGERIGEEKPVPIVGGYEVIVPGTVIDGIYYPKAEGTCVKGQEMTADIDDAQAQELVNCGVRLSKDGEELAAVKEEEPEPEVPEPEPKAVA